MALKGSDEWRGRSDYADTFAKRAAGELPEMESSKAAANILQKEIVAGDSILDVGCGAGHYLRSLQGRIKVDFQYTGVDYTKEFVDAAKKVWEQDSKSSFHVGSIYDLPFKDNEFDVVMCNNVVLHLPSIVKPIAELSRVARRFILIRTLIGDKSFRVQEVFSKDTWPFSSVPTKQEFDDSGEPVSFGFHNIYSRGYFESVVHRTDPNADIELIEDTFFDPDALNKSADFEGLPNATRHINGMQVFGYLLTPWYFAKIRPGATK